MRARPSTRADVAGKTSKRPGSGRLHRAFFSRALRRSSGAFRWREARADQYDTARALAHHAWTRPAGSCLPLRCVAKRPSAECPVDDDGGWGDPDDSPNRLGQRPRRSPVANRRRRSEPLRGVFAVTPHAAQRSAGSDGPRPPVAVDELRQSSAASLSRHPRATHRSARGASSIVSRVGLVGSGDL